VIHPLYCPRCGAEWTVHEQRAGFEASPADVQRNEVRYVVIARIPRRCPSCGQGEATPWPFAHHVPPAASFRGRPVEDVEWK